MDFNFSIIGINIPFCVLLSGGFLIAFIITFLSIPTIVRISVFMKLFDIPNERASHTSAVPNLGGLSIFAGFTLAAILCSLPAESSDIKYIIGGIIVLFFLGLKDDILLIDPIKKFLGQIVASTIIVVLGDIRVTDLHMFLGIGPIPYLPSVLFTVFLFLALINGFNLIDGVDGLASGTGILASLTFGIWFILDRHFTYSILCFSLMGSLFAYFRFNVFGKTNKIFMGDTGSMITGLIVAVFAAKFLEFEKSAPAAIQLVSAPAAAFCLLIIPLFDTLRVFILRIKNRRSPFVADRNHLHHDLLRLGFSHLKATAVLLSVNLVLILIVFLLQGLGNLALILLVLVVSSLLSFLPVFILRQRENTERT